MAEHSKDTQRVMAAAKALLDGRDPVLDRSQVLVTLDHLICLMLITAMEGDALSALALFTEGTVPHVEERIMQFENRR